MTMLDAIKYMAETLIVIKAIECLDKGVIPDSTCVFTGDTVYHKTYIITVHVPYTKLVLKKTTNGSFNTEELLKTIKYVKDLYGRN